MYKSLASVWPRPKQFALVAGSRAAEERPKLAARVSTLFAISVDFEQTKAAILIHLLQGEPLAGMEMFMSLRSAQAVALNAVVNSKAPGQAKLFARVLKAGKKFEAHRNRFAHWVWAYCEELPDHLCLEDPRFSVRFNVMLLTTLGPTMMAHGPSATAFREGMQERHEQRRSKTIVYDEAALEEVTIQGLDALGLLVRFFHAVVAIKPEERAKRFLELEALLPAPEQSDSSSDPHDE